jgi:hypothetical protein
MNAKTGIGIVALLGLVAALFFQYRQTRTLTAENDALRRQAAELAATPQLQVVEDPRAGTAEAEHTELLRLRAEVTRLKQAVATANATATAANAKAASLRTAPAAAEVGVLKDADRARDEHQQYRLQTVNLGKQLGIAARIFESDHSDQLPTSFEALVPYLNGGDAVANLMAERFEFHGHGRKVDFTEPALILFREKAARQTPDGRWERIYSLMDGSVQTVTRDTNDFAEFESARTGTPANAPTNPVQP